MLCQYMGNVPIHLNQLLLMMFVKGSVLLSPCHAEYRHTYRWTCEYYSIHSNVFIEIFYK